MSCFETVERVKLFSLLLSKEAADAGFVHLSHLLSAAHKEADDLLYLVQSTCESPIGFPSTDLPADLLSRN